MPQADLKYSGDVKFDTIKLLADIEALILRHDSGAGACKGRAYPAQAFHHSHVLLEVGVLDKPHRDKAFMQALLDDLTALLDAALPKGTERAVSLKFALEHYETGQSA